MQAAHLAPIGELEELADGVFLPPTSYALIHAGLAENDRAFDLLEKGLAEHDSEMSYLKHEPEWEPIRDDPRWAELISRISYFIED